MFLSAEMGLGITSLLRELAKESRPNTAVIFIQGTPSLAGVPFGVLTPYLQRDSSALVVSAVDAIREMLALLAEKEAELRQTLGPDTPLGLPLFIIDEADYIDGATAELVVRLVQAGQMKLVVSHRSARDLVHPLPQLWDAGLAERIHLHPLTLQEGREFCDAALGGRTMAGTSWYLWSTAGGNPLLMSLIMAEAHAGGLLRKKGGAWTIDMTAMPRGHQLQDVVREQLRGISPVARQALNLVALSEPVPEAVIAEMLGHDPVRELQERHLIHEPTGRPGELQLINPVYGDVIRNMVSRTESLLLHQQLMDRLESDDSNPQAVVRRVVWSLESGGHVAPERLLLAGIYACKLFRPQLAMSLADSITGTEFVVRARAVKARAHYDMGEYEAAAKFLDGAEAQAESLSELVFGAILHSATREALGEPALLIDRDAQTLRATGIRLAAADPEHSAEILLQSAERATVLDILVLSRTGNYGEEMVAAIGAMLAREERAGDGDFWLNRAIVLAIDAERLTALGRPAEGMARAGQALAIPQWEGHDVFFLPEMILGRALTASLAAGAWDEVESVLRATEVDLGPAIVSFGGSANVARGMILLRQGKISDALEALLPGIEALAVSDPQHLAGYGTAMAFYSAAVLGRKAEAERLHGLYRESTGMYVVTTHERAYLAAGLGHLRGDGAGRLMAVAATAAAAGHHLAELNALALAMDFDAVAVLPKLKAAAGLVDGRWSAALADFAKAMTASDGAVAVDAGERLLAARMFAHAAAVFRHGISLSIHDRQGTLAQAARTGLAAAAAELAPSALAAAAPVQVQVPAVPDDLTTREREVSRLAATGLTDKDIAEQLQVSVRTVEGHLYRSYAKLGIAGRSELSLVFTA
ncbi:helix-turn-helix transcriptional regulator [Arthrobacter sp. ERGS1:01]|uniref:helix-turn-helix transcriptional regulator n=1 Tax=Arthrobacter sp. ERGS1:01 TaxID=1704044 RepID=UPI001237208B|nr:helix-turn-helix transcriptional regulator [Arthrobacter sp. ERGS1:01]